MKPLKANLKAKSAWLFWLKNTEDQTPGKEGPDTTPPLPTEGLAERYDALGTTPEPDDMRDGRYDALGTTPDPDDIRDG